MPFVNDILQHRSVSFVGLEKNTGKTECLNYVLHRLSRSGKRIALTSIGIDGEQSDSVTRTSKPEVTVYAGMIFVTSEQHYLQRKIVSEILDVSDERTALGRLITAQAVMDGQVILSGPADTAGIKRLIAAMEQLDVDTTLVDGALSRLSLASPAVTEAMILATGAAVSTNIRQLVHKTRFAQRLINLEAVEPALAMRLQDIDKGVWAIDKKGGIHDLDIPSAFLLDKNEKDLFRFGTRIYVAGAVSSKLLDFFRMQPQKAELIIRDFSALFTTSDHFDAFLHRGNRIKCLFRTQLLAITVNPTAPNGFRFHPESLKREMEQALGIGVYDIVQLKKIS